MWGPENADRENKASGEQLDTAHQRSGDSRNTRLVCRTDRHKYRPPRATSTFHTIFNPVDHAIATSTITPSQHYTTGRKRSHAH